MNSDNSTNKQMNKWTFKMIVKPLVKLKAIMSGLFLSVLCSPVLATNIVTSLSVSGNVATFKTQDAKPASTLPCITSGNEHYWTVATDDNSGLYELLTIAQKSEQPIEIESAGSCLGGSEKASNINVNYRYSATESPSIASNLNFVARTSVEMQENKTVGSVTFTLTSTGGYNNLQTATASGDHYLYDFGLLAVGTYTLETLVTSGEATATETAAFTVAPVNLVDIYQVDDDIYLQLPATHNNQYVHLKKNTDGTWTAVVIDKAAWDLAVDGVVSSLTYNIEFGDFAGGDALEDFKLTGGSEPIVIEQTETSYQYYQVTSAQWLEKGGTTDDVSPPTGSAPLASTFIGAVAGSAGVSGGAASYNIPIALPPGRNGMQPHVSLNYNSRSGNGIAGVGWGLSAAGAISRCGATYSQDELTRNPQYDSNDRLCLNGQRLVLEDDTAVYGATDSTYRTEIDTFVIVTQHGTLDDASFTVTNANGTINTYGDSTSSTNSRVLHQDAPEHISWLLSTRSDVSQNNFIRYEYQKYGAGEFLLTNIEYTLDSALAVGDRSVSFAYVDRSDTSVSYIAGGKSEQTKVLSNIKTFYNNSTVHEYHLNVELSTATKRTLLKSVQHCTYGSGAKTCQNLSIFDWQEQPIDREITALGYKEANDKLVQPYSDLRLIEGAIPRGDSNGDGLRDFSKFYMNAEGVYTGKPKVTLATCMRQHATMGYNCVDADINLDGKTDSLSYDTNKLKITYTNGSVITTQIPLVTRGDSRNDTIVHAADFDGDGWPDLVATHFIGAGQELEYKLYLHSQNVASPYGAVGYLLGNQKPISKEVDNTTLNGTQILSFVGDLDGNGLPDIAINKSWTSITITGTGVSARISELEIETVKYNDSSPGINTYRDKDMTAYNKQPAVIVFASPDVGGSYITFADINGDGLADLLDVGMGVFRLNLGDRTFGQEFTGYKLPRVNYSIETADGNDIVNGTALYFNNAIRYMDINSDGKMELLVPGDVAVESCSRVYDYNKSNIQIKKTLCGKGLYGKVRSSHDKVHLKRPIDWNSKDESIYYMNAISFEQDKDGVWQKTTTPTSILGSAHQSAVVDVYGNGLADMMFVYGSRQGNGNECDPNQISCNWFPGEETDSPLAGLDYGIYVNRNKGSTSETYGASDMMLSADNNVGIKSTWYYRPLSSGIASQNGDFYSADFSSKGNGYINFASSMYVVQSFKQSSGINTDNETQFTYQGAMYHTQGRGFRGFEKIIETQITNTTDIVTNVNTDTKIRTETTFKQLFPYSGLVENQAIFDATNDNLLSQVTNVWIENSEHEAANSYHLFNSSATQITCSLGLSTCDELTKSVTTVTQAGIDGFGNIKSSTTVVNDDYGTYTTTHSAEYPISANHLPSFKKVLSKAVSYKAQKMTIDLVTGINVDKTVTTDFVWDMTHRKPEKITVSGDDGTKGTVTDIKYTSHGLPKTTTVTGTANTSEEQARLTTVKYSIDGYFPESITQKATATTDHVTSMTTDAATGLPLTVTDVADVVTTNQYDDFYRLKQVDSTGMPSQYIRYHTADTTVAHAVMIVEATQAGVPNTKQYKDALGRTLRTSTQGFNNSYAHQDITYNERGLKTSETMPHNGTRKTTTYSYIDPLNPTREDVLGRVRTKVTPTAKGNLSTNYTYSGLTTTIAVTPSDGSTSISMSRTYNALKQLMQTIDAKAGVTAYAYDGQGNPIAIKDANDNVINAHYNALARKTEVNDPNMGTTKFVYNDFGDLEKEEVVDGNADVVETKIYVVDFLGRVTSRSAEGSDATFTWDSYNGKTKNGLLARHSENSVSKVFTYDDITARLTNTAITVDSITYNTTLAYDAGYGRVKSMQYPDGLTVAYGYNDTGYLIKESNAASDYVYREIKTQDVLGNTTSAHYGGGVLTLAANHELATGQMLTSVANGNAGAAQHLGYFYNSYGNLTKQENYALTSTTTEDYGYDKLHRLTSLNITADGTVLPVVAYGYDAAGNFTKKSDYSQNTVGAYKYITGTNKVNKVTLADNTSMFYGYDNKGNQTKRGITANPTNQEVWYNSFNKPTAIKRNGAEFTFIYGADLARYKQVRKVEGKTITTHYIDKHYEVEWTGGHKRSKAYISDAAIISDGDEALDRTIHLTLRDRLGSATLFADHNGAVTAKRHFDPFGKPRGGDWTELTALTGASRLVNNLQDTDMPSRRGFTDHEHLDEAELIHMNGRVYDYNLGRFMSVDPLIQGVGNSQGINPYSYIMNNPLGGTDPTGYNIEEVKATGSNIKGGFAGSRSSVSMPGNSQSGRARTSGAEGQGTKNAVVAGQVKTTEIKSSANDGSGTNVGGTPSADQSIGAKLGVAGEAIKQFGGEIIEDATFMAGDVLATTLAGSKLPETPEEYAALAKRGTEIIRLGHAGKGNELSYAEAWYLYKNVPKGFELTVDGRVVGDIGGKMATPFPLDSLKVHGHVSLNAQGRIKPGMYDFDPVVMSNPNNSLRIYIRNELNQIAIRQHGAGNPYLIKYSYDDKDFK
ncbi:MAG: RHS repeat-associated protein [Alteromonadaceae bacterium]|jgi:RHS repeat-associated protein